MFIIMQFPFADLRPLIPGQKGRLSKPDWSNYRTPSGFVRGFGKVSERNKTSLGLEGEGIFADCNHVLKFPKMIDVSATDWSCRLHANVWFRRLYFDGRISGRFEVAFHSHDEEEETLYVRRQERHDQISIDIGRVISIVEKSPVQVVSPDTSVWNGNLDNAGKALGLAYITATTAQSARSDSVEEIYGKDVIVGPPRTHIRVDAKRNLIRTRDEFVLAKDRNSELYNIFC